MGGKDKDGERDGIDQTTKFQLDWKGDIYIYI
jgi:hypothetical protein